MPALEIIIRYGRGTGEDEALALARRLFAHLDEAIDALTLAPVEEDDLAVYVNGRLVISQREAGRAPRVADVIAILADR